MTDYQSKPEIMVSIICLTYNHEAFIRHALDGFLAQQTDFAYEVIVHDDASTDGTQAVLHEYAERYPDVIKPILQEENQLSKRVRIVPDIMMPVCRGKYLAFCEGDDQWTDPQKLQRQVDAMEANPEVTFCFGCARRYDVEKDCEAGVIPARHGELSEGIIDGRELLRLALYDLVHLSTWMVKKEVYARYCSDPPACYRTIFGNGDTKFTLFSAINGRSYFIKRVFSQHNVNVPGSWTKRVITDKEKALAHNRRWLKLCRAFLEIVPEEYKAVVENKCLEIEFNLLLTEERYREALSGRFRRILRGKGLVYRVKLTAKAVLHKRRSRSGTPGKEGSEQS